MGMGDENLYKINDPGHMTKMTAVVYFPERIYHTCFTTQAKIPFRFVSFLLNVTVNIFSVMSGRSHRFLCITSTFGE